MKRYIVKYLDQPVDLSIDWNAPSWRKISSAKIDCFHPRGSDHKPRTLAKICYDVNGIKLIFRTEDKYIRSVHTKYNSKVNEDSCVEWFIKPAGSLGYYNFEMNAGGCLHVNYIVDPERDKNGKRKDIRPIPEDQANLIKVMSSLPEIIDPEITRPLIWYLAVDIPFPFFKRYTPAERILHSDWRGNLYKCGDKTSHPHWASWSPVSELNFHRPHEFGIFEFERWGERAK